MLQGNLTCQDIDEKVFKHYNYDGLAAHADLQTIIKADDAKQSLKLMAPMWVGMTGISAYNLTRMGVLSNSGRVGAIGGLAFGAIMTINSFRM